MTAEERASELALTFLEDFDDSAIQQQRYQGLKHRVAQALTEAVAEEQERCAKVADRWANDGALNGAEIAAAIRKVKP